MVQTMANVAEFERQRMGERMKKTGIFELGMSDKVRDREPREIRIARTEACPLAKSNDLGGGKPCKHHSWASSSR